MTKYKIQNQNGQAAITAVIFLLFILLSILGAISNLALKEARGAERNFRSKTAFFTAEAGVEDAVYRLKRAKNLSSSFVISLNNSLSTTTVNDVPGGKEIKSSGEFLHNFRSLRSILVTGEGIEFFYGAQVGEGGLLMTNDSRINGNVYSNGIIDGANSARIIGDATAVGAISDMTVGSSTTGIARAPSFLNTIVHGSTCPNQYCIVGSNSIQSFSISAEQITNWKNEATAGGTISGNYTLSGTQSVSLGPKKITGKLTISNDAVLTIIGRIWVVGEINISNTATVKLNPSYGNTSEIIISDNKISITNDANFEKAGPSSYIMMISNSNDQSSAIKLSNDASALIIFAPNGAIELSGTSNLKEVTGYKLILKNDAQVNYESGLANVNFSSGPSGNWSISEWKEVIQ